jgi:hypothetical protein
VGVVGGGSWRGSSVSEMGRDEGKQEDEAQKTVCNRLQAHGSFENNGLPLYIRRTGDVRRAIGLVRVSLVACL